MSIFSLLAENPGINIFGFTITAYALIIVTGMIVAFFVISLLFKRRNMSGDLFLTFFCICLPVAIITTRLFYCITNNMPIQDWFSFDSIRKGGLSIIGGIIGGAASIAAVCFFKKVNFFRVGDCVVVGLLIAQCIGRWGNFANQEVYGAVVENPALQCFPFAVYINPTGNCMQTFELTFAKWFGYSTTISGGEWHYAFFLYESLVTGIAAVLLFINAWKNPNKPNGVNSALYFVVYGLVRSIMEPLRDSSFILGLEPGNLGIPWSLVFSLLMLVGGVALLVVLLLLNKKKEGKLFGSLNGDPYGISTYIGDTKDEKPAFNKINLMCKLRPENYQAEEQGIEKEENNQPPEVAEQTECAESGAEEQTKEE